MFVMMAPYPQLSTTTLMPSPNFGDSKLLRSSVKTMRTTDGTLYTYVISRDQLKKFKWDFVLSLNKAKELSDFIDTYFASKIKIIDHDDAVHIGYLKNNPVDFVGRSRAFGWPGDEDVNISLELEETQ
jgi:hypothetical protein